MHDALHEGPNKEKAPHDLAVQTAPSADLIAVARVNSERQGARPSWSPAHGLGSRGAPAKDMTAIETPAPIIMSAENYISQRTNKSNADGKACA